MSPNPPPFWLFKIQPQAIETLNKLLPMFQRSIFQHLSNLLHAENPYQLSFVEMLKAEKFARLRKFSTEDYRVFFLVEVKPVVHLENTYKGTLFVVDIQIIKKPIREKRQIMGTWGKGNFQSDKALDYLDEIRNQLIKDIDDCCKALSLGELDLDDGNHVLMPSLDILTALCQHYDVTPWVELDKLLACKVAYLELYDAEIETYTPKMDYIIGRRKVVEETFEKLEELCRKDPWTNTPE